MKQQLEEEEKKKNNWPELLIISHPLVIPTVHKVQQKHNLNKKEQARTKFGRSLCIYKPTLDYTLQNNSTCKLYT